MDSARRQAYEREMTAHSLADAEARLETSGFDRDHRPGARDNPDYMDLSPWG